MMQVVDRLKLAQLLCALDPLLAQHYLHNSVTKIISSGSKHYSRSTTPNESEIGKLHSFRGLG